MTEHENRAEASAPSEEEFDALAEELRLADATNVRVLDERDALRVENERLRALLGDFVICLEQTITQIARTAARSVDEVRTELETSVLERARGFLSSSEKGG